MSHYSLLLLTKESKFKYQFLFCWNLANSAILVLLPFSFGWWQPGFGQCFCSASLRRLLDWWSFGRIWLYCLNLFRELGCVLIGCISVRLAILRPSLRITLLPRADRLKPSVRWLSSFLYCFLALVSWHAAVAYLDWHQILERYWLLGRAPRRQADSIHSWIWQQYDGDSYQNSLENASFDLSSHSFLYSYGFYGTLAYFTRFQAAHLKMKLEIWWSSNQRLPIFGSCFHCHRNRPYLSASF